MAPSAHDNVDILAGTADILIRFAGDPETRLPQVLGKLHLSFYGQLRNVLGNRQELVETCLRTRAPEHLASVRADFERLFDQAHSVDHERGEGNSANIAVCMAKGTARGLAEKLRLVDNMLGSVQARPERRPCKKSNVPGQTAENRGTQVNVNIQNSNNVTIGNIQQTQNLVRRRY